MNRLELKVLLEEVVRKVLKEELTSMVQIMEAMRPTNSHQIPIQEVNQRPYVSQPVARPTITYTTPQQNTPVSEEPKGFNFAALVNSTYITPEDRQHLRSS